MKLVILHYHLLPGGVTGVIVEATRALLHYCADIDDITLVCGRHENTDAVRGLILSGVDDVEMRNRVRIDVVPAVDYTDHGGNSSTEAIRHEIVRRYCGPDTIIWVHNFQLGKNPALTRAVVDIATTRPEQRLILQIHDFPECARYENLARLDSEIPGTMYPTTNNVRYAVINARDHDMLARSGVPSERVRLLENPVAVPVSGRDGSDAPDAEKTQALRRRLFDAFGSRFPSVRPDAPILLYPVRTIRRKNVLEAGFIAAASSRPVNLLVTLPGVSVQEHIYSDLVSQTYSEGLIPGLWGIGRETEALGMSFSDLVDLAEMVISSSVQEGFGYQFISSIIWGKPLLARYLDILDSVLSVFSGFPHELYDTVAVPLHSPSVSSLRSYLSMRYQERLHEIAHFLPGDAVDSLRSELSTMLTHDAVDFSFLPIQVQYALLKDLRDPAYRSDIESLNSTLFGALSSLLDSPTPPLLARVDERFGLQAFARSFSGLLASFTATDFTPPGSVQGDTTVRRNLVRAFAHKEYLRLLYAPPGH